MPLQLHIYKQCKLDQLMHYYYYQWVCKHTDGQ